MKKKILFISILSFMLFIFIYVYDNYVRDYELVINEETVYVASKSKLNKELDKELDKYSTKLINKSKEAILEIEKAYNEDVEINEEVNLIVISDYEYEIIVIHQVERKIDEVIPFDKKTKEDDNQYIDYKEITTEGKDGKSEVSYTVVYENGLFKDLKNYESTLIEAVTEVTIVGTKEIPQTTNSGSNWSSNTGNGNWNGGSTGGSTGGIVTVSPPPPIPPNALWYWWVSGYGDGSIGYTTEAACLEAAKNQMFSIGGTGGYLCYQK